MRLVREKNAHGRQCLRQTRHHGTCGWSREVGVTDRNNETNPRNDLPRRGRQLHDIVKAQSQAFPLNNRKRYLRKAGEPQTFSFKSSAIAEPFPARSRRICKRFLREPEPGVGLTWCGARLKSATSQSAPHRQTDRQTATETATETETVTVTETATQAQTHHTLHRQADAVQKQRAANRLEPIASSQRQRRSSSNPTAKSTSKPASQPKRKG
eukprot:3887644-Rhodomonas_salina.1